jgi:HAD superfamily hydrolase (TIGR01509 family)
MGKLVLRAIIFDFNGILVDDEPVHLEMFREVLKEEGISLDDRDYYARYLGMDDRGCFKAVFKDHRRELGESSLADLIRRKALYYRESIAKKLTVFPGVKEIIPALASHLPLAIASGALKSEIQMILEIIGLVYCFKVIVSAEVVTEGKPSPEIFVKALTLLNQRQIGKPIQPTDCLVVEDSKEGILAAHHAGMKCLAVPNSLPIEELSAAEAVVNGLDEVSFSILQELFQSPRPFSKRQSP